MTFPSCRPLLTLQKFFLYIKILSSYIFSMLLCFLFYYFALFLAIYSWGKRVLIQSYPNPVTTLLRKRSAHRLDHRRYGQGSRYKGFWTSPPHLRIQPAYNSAPVGAMKGREIWNERGKMKEKEGKRTRDEGREEEENGKKKEWKDQRKSVRACVRVYVHADGVKDGPVWGTRAVVPAQGV